MTAQPSVRRRSVLPNNPGASAPNRYTIHGDVVHIELTDRENRTIAVTKISLCDLDRVISVGRWYCSFRKTVNYVSRSYRQGKMVRVDRLHRFITGDVKGMVVDHINGDSLDNRRENLRVVTQSVNGRNQNAPARSRTGIRNINKVSENSFRVRFTVDRKTTERYFPTLEEASQWAEESRPLYQTHQR